MDNHLSRRWRFQLPDEPLIPLNQIFVKQNIDILEIMVGFEQANRYTFYSPDGQTVYIGDEQSDCCARQYCRNARGFQLHIRGPFGNGILLGRPYNCVLSRMGVLAIATGELLGKIKQQCVCCKGARFHVLDQFGNVIFIIKAPLCTDACCGNVTFDVACFSNLDVLLGQITKLWTGLGQEMRTNADNFGISFPQDLSVKIKAILLGACALVDFMLYENMSHRRRGYY